MYIGSFPQMSDNPEFCLLIFKNEGLKNWLEGLDGRYFTVRQPGPIRNIRWVTYVIIYFLVGTEKDKKKKVKRNMWD